MNEKARFKVDRVIEYLTEGHLHSDGGYPYDFVEHAGKIFVATLDDAKERNRTLICVYTIRQLETWYNRAVKHIKEWDLSDKWPEMTGLYFGDWGEAFGETE